jgi:hypothetical protein
MSNLWLNPDLLRQDRNATPLPISGELAAMACGAPGLQGASGSVQGIVRGRQETAAATRRERRTSTRRLCLRLAALALLGGSAAFSYVAWSDEMRGRRVHGEWQATDREAPTETRSRGTSPALAHELRLENIALRERIARLERAIEAVAAMNTPTR